MRLTLLCSSAAILLALGLTGCGESSKRTAFVVSGDQQGRPAGLVCAELPPRPQVGAVYTLRSSTGNSVPGQADEQGKLWWWAEPVAPGQSVTYVAQPGGRADADSGVVVQAVEEGRIDARIDGQLFTSFHFAPHLPKPFLHPVIGPTGNPVTRDYPMVDTEAEKANKRQDHRHHRSIWTAHGDVRTDDLDNRGHNYWNEAIEKGDDPQRVRGILATVSGPVFGRVQAQIDWLGDDGRPEFTEERTYTFFRGDETCRIVDVRIRFQFTERDVLFADTKEGGLVAVRTAISIDEIGGGSMCNSRGQKGEEQCWGQRAEWCDYVGTLNGQTVGIAIFDAPGNFRHPTPWHIRGYGLFAANPFGIREFSKDKSQDGSKLWRKGETVEFNYRIFIHAGDTVAARVADQYRLYTNPASLVRG
ncbi:MAG TPA: PmoA family protein [Phycisphaerae bacterium]|nr:PmoA family protein [Phycisphaerae bacterium]